MATINLSIDDIKKYFEQRTEEQAAYIIAAILALCSSIAVDFDKKYAASFLIIGTFFLCYGFLVFILPLLQGIWNSFIGKMIIDPLFL